MIISMDVILNPKPGRNHFMPDALSRREELIIHRLLMLVEKDLTEMNDGRETMKHDEDAVINNQFFDERGSKKNLPGGRRMKNLRQKNELHYFKETRLYMLAGELRKILLHEFYDMPLAGYKGIRATMAKL